MRLLARVIFCWFLVEKRLIPSDLFREHRLKALLKECNPSKDVNKPDIASTYYHAVLQNLFFGTLNMPPEQRGFCEKDKARMSNDNDNGITNLWRYKTDFRASSDWITLAARVPFLNGGLFDWTRRRLRNPITSSLMAFPTIPSSPAVSLMISSSVPSARWTCPGTTVKMIDDRALEKGQSSWTHRDSFSLQVHH